MSFGQWLREFFTQRKQIRSQSHGESHAGSRKSGYTLPINVPDAVPFLIASAFERCFSRAPIDQAMALCPTPDPTSPNALALERQLSRFDGQLLLTISLQDRRTLWAAIHHHFGLNLTHFRTPTHLLKMPFATPEIPATWRPAIISLAAQSCAGPKFQTSFIIDALAISPPIFQENSAELLRLLKPFDHIDIKKIPAPMQYKTWDRINQHFGLNLQESPYPASFTRLNPNQRPKRDVMESDNTRPDRR
ncbi:MAG: hypothetical protein ACP5M1_12670 [Acidiphilium sp.]